MTQNLFVIKTQNELSSTIHDSDKCPGNCDSCIKFHKAVTAMASLAEGTIVLTENKAPIGGPKGYFQSWCNDCSDGVNNTFYEACDWADSHAKRRHG